MDDNAVSSIGAVINPVFLDLNTALPASAACERLL